MLRLGLALGLHLLALLQITAARAETAVEFSTKNGYSSNLFEDPSALSGAFWQASLKLRGSLETENGKITYGAAQTEQRTGAYRFGDTHQSEFNLGYAFQLGKTARLEIGAAYVRNQSGDVFLVLPNRIIGYRTDDRGLQLQAGITTTGLGGKTSFSAKYASIKKGDARFDTALLRPAKLDPDVGLATVAANHYLPAWGGEVCLCTQVERSLISTAEQRLFNRLPATAMRGSLAYARALPNGLTLIGETGLTVLASSHLPGNGRMSTPYLRAEAEWKDPAGLDFSVAAKREMLIGDIDDALAEDATSYRVAVSKALSDRVRVTLAFDRSHNDYVYYVYARNRNAYTGTLTLGTASSAKVDLEYSHARQSETDVSANYRVNTVSAKVSGSF